MTSFPDDLSLVAAAANYQIDARRIEELLHDHLPGGTYCELLRAMLTRRASHFRVPFGGVDGR